MIDNLFSLIVAGLIGEFILIIYLLTILDNRTNDEYILPIIEPIAEDTLQKDSIINTGIAKYIDEPIIIIETSRMGLTAKGGVYHGPSGKETWYNLPMHNIVNIMRSKGYTEEDYPYYIREDGVKMLGDFVIVAADFNKYPRGTIMETSLGQGIVCDTGEFVDTDVILDIAVDW